MNNQIQSELDIVEEHILNCLFGSASNPQINQTLRTGLVFIGKNHIQMINSAIIGFEQYVKPFLKDNGYIDGNKLSRLIEAKFNKQVPLGDIRMIEVSRAIEPLLLMLGSFIR